MNVKDRTIGDIFRDGKRSIQKKTFTKSLDDNFLSPVYIFSEISLRYKEKKGNKKEPIW